MAAFALLTASGRSLYPNAARSSSCSPFALPPAASALPAPVARGDVGGTVGEAALASHHLLYQDDQHEHEYGGKIEGNSTDAQRGKESPDGSEDGLGQIVKNTVQDRQTRKPPASSERKQEIEDDPAQQYEPVECQQKRQDKQDSRQVSGLVKEAPLLEPAPLLGGDFDVSWGQEKDLLGHTLDAPVQPEREASREVDQALGRLGLHGLQVHDHGDVSLELLADLLGVVEARGLDEVDLPGGD